LTGDYEVSGYDIHVLTGAVKLFFRELSQPLIPVDLLDLFIAAYRTSHLRLVHYLSQSVLVATECRSPDCVVSLPNSAVARSSNLHYRAWPGGIGYGAPLLTVHEMFLSGGHSGTSGMMARAAAKLLATLIVSRRVCRLCVCMSVATLMPNILETKRF